MNTLNGKNNIVPFKKVDPFAGLEEVLKNVPAYDMPDYTDCEDDHDGYYPNH